MSTKEELKSKLSKLKSFLFSFLGFLFPPIRMIGERKREELELKSCIPLDCSACHQSKVMLPQKGYKSLKIIRILFGYLGRFIGIVLLFIAFGMLIHLMIEDYSSGSTADIAFGAFIAMGQMMEGMAIFALFLSGLFFTFLSHFFMKKRCFYSCKRCGFQLEVKAFAKSVEPSLSSD